MPGYKAQGNDLENLYDPDVVGDGYVATGLRVNGDANATHYANRIYGSTGPYSGYNTPAVGDVGNQWAAKGTAQYNLPINGKSYSSNNQSRGKAEVRFIVFNNGNVQIQDWRSDTQNTVLDSLMIMSDGSSPSQWSVSFDYSISNVSTVGSGATCNAESNAPAPTLQNVASAPGPGWYAGGYAQAAIVGTRATCNSTITMHAYKDGVHKYDCTIYGYNNVNGN